MKSVLKIKRAGYPRWIPQEENKLGMKSFFASTYYFLTRLRNSKVYANNVKRVKAASNFLWKKKKFLQFSCQGKNPVRGRSVGDNVPRGLGPKQVRRLGMCGCAHAIINRCPAFIGFIGNIFPKRMGQLFSLLWHEILKRFLFDLKNRSENSRIIFLITA